mgnify:CR=1 FL=1
MLSQDKITQIFCSIDDFCKDFVPNWESQLLSNGKKRIRKSNLSISEVVIDNDSSDVTYMNCSNSFGHHNIHPLCA